VIYDEGEVIKRGTYAASVPRAGPWSRGWCWRVRPQGAMCRLPYLQDLQVAPTAVAYCPRAARSFTSRYGHVVTHHELWYRYVPEPSTWHGWTFTNWTAALPAATGLLPSGWWKPSAFPSWRPGGISLCPQRYAFRGSITRPGFSRSLQLHTPIAGCARGVRFWPAGEALAREDLHRRFSPTG